MKQAVSRECNALYEALQAWRKLSSEITATVVNSPQHFRQAIENAIEQTTQALNQADQQEQGTQQGQQQGTQSRTTIG